MPRFIKFASSGKSFLKGMSRVFDLFGKLDKHRMQSDYDALKDDWKMVGKDISDSFKSFDGKR